MPIIVPVTSEGQTLINTLPSGIVTITNGSWYNVVTNGTTLNRTPMVISPNSTSLITSGSILTTGCFTNTLPTITVDDTYLYYNTANANIINGYVHTSSADAAWSARQEKAKNERQRKRLHAVHRAKGSIKRALKLMDNVGFGDDIRIFLGGDDMEISYPDSMFKFVMTKSKYGTLVDSTIHPSFSTPYKLALYTKTNVHVANLCVYLKDTPILDQLLAVSMYIRTGNEDHILETANWSRITDDEDTLLTIAVDRPNLSHRLKHHRFKNPEIQDIFSN